VVGRGSDSGNVACSATLPLSEIDMTLTDIGWPTKIVLPSIYD